MKEMENSFPCLGVSVGENRMGKREHPFLFVPLKPQIFIPPENRRNGRE